MLITLETNIEFLEQWIYNCLYQTIVYFNLDIEREK
jgi:hypothetical protein